MSQPLRYNKHEIPCIAMMDRNKGPVGCLKLWTTQTHTHIHLKEYVSGCSSNPQQKNTYFLGGREYVREGGLVEEPMFFFWRASLHSKLRGTSPPTHPHVTSTIYPSRFFLDKAPPPRAAKHHLDAIQWPPYVS